MTKRVTSSLGFEIKRAATGGLELRTTLGQSYSHLKKLGANPKTIFDVGVAGGTEELYTKFPEAFFMLVEPIESFESDMKAILKHYTGSYVVAAAGAEAGEVTFHIHDHAIEGSSLYQETMGEEADGRQVTVPMVTLDEVAEEKKLEGPYLIKIDVQGAELDVLEGSTECLKETEIVVLEVSLFEFMKGAPQLHEVVSYMHKKGFVAFDIIPGWNRPLDGALGQVDIVFVQENGRYRQDHSYASLDQVKGLSSNGQAS
ncbi:MAG: FkbM family methyltransferase [Planctomycetota bacterium]